METLKVKIKKIRPNAKLPQYHSETASAADLYAALDAPMTIAPGEIVKIPTGIAIECERNDLSVILCARSGLASKGVTLANGIGVVDTDYRGEILILTVNLSDKPYIVMPEERVAQMMFIPILTASFEEAKELSDTARGAGGFGSTGRK